MYIIIKKENSLKRKYSLDPSIYTKSKANALTSLIKNSFGRNNRRLTTNKDKSWEFPISLRFHFIVLASRCCIHRTQMLA